MFSYRKSPAQSSPFEEDQLEYQAFDAEPDAPGDFYDSLDVTDAPYEQIENKAPAEEKAENEEEHENDEVDFDVDVPDDVIDLNDFIPLWKIKTRREQVKLLCNLVLSIFGPLLFFTSAFQFPSQYEAFYNSLMELLSITCRFTSEDIEAIAYDGTVVRLEAIRYTTTTVLLTIISAAVFMTYYKVKQPCAFTTFELVDLLKQKNAKNADILYNYEFSTALKRDIIQSIQAHGVQKELLGELRDQPSRFNQMTINIYHYRQEVMRYFKMMLVGFTLPGLVYWLQKGSSLGEKIDCDKSTVIFNTCPAEKQYAHLALLVYPLMSSSFMTLGVVSSSMLAYPFTPERFAKKFNDKIHQRILKFLSLRDEDKALWAHREFVWAFGFIFSLPLLGLFSVTRAANTTNEFAAISHCPSWFAQWWAIIKGVDISTPECTAAKATLIFGGGIADLEVDKFYPLYILAEITFYSLGILLTTFTPFRLLFPLEKVNQFLEHYNRIHFKAMDVGSYAVAVIGVPLFFRALNFAMPINQYGITEQRKFDNLLLTNSSVSFINMTLAEGAKQICPNDSINFLEQLKKLSFGELMESVTYLGNSVFNFVVTKGCPQFAKIGGVMLLYGLTLGIQAIPCNQSTYIRFYSGFLAVYWSGVSGAFVAGYLPAFYGGLIAWALKACADKQLAAKPQAAIAPPIAQNRNGFFARLAVQDERKVPLLDADDAAQNEIGDFDNESAENSPRPVKSGMKKLSSLWRAPVHNQGGDVVEMHSSRKKVAR